MSVAVMDAQNVLVLPSMQREASRAVDERVALMGVTDERVAPMAPETTNAVKLTPSAVLRPSQAGRGGASSANDCA